MSPIGLGQPEAAGEDLPVAVNKGDERDRRVKNTRGKGRQAVEGITGGAVEEASSAQSRKAVRIMEHLG